MPGYPPEDSQAQARRVASSVVPEGRWVVENEGEATKEKAALTSSMIEKPVEG